MNAYVKALCEVEPAGAAGVELLRELLTKDNLTVDDLMRRQAEIEAAEAELYKLGLRSREAIKRCLELRALPAQSQAPTGF